MTTMMPTLPAVADLQSYMRSVGWSESPPGTMGTLWTKGDYEIGLPRAVGRDERIMWDVLARLARAEHLDIDAVARKARYFRIDVTQFRASDEERTPDGILLSAGERIVASVRGMLRSVGTTAIRERNEIRGNFNPRGDAVTGRAIMGYTERGSYIIPVLIPLSAVEGAPDQFILDGTQDLPQEPFERRVVRTLAQALDAVDRLVVQPDREPDVDSLYALVERGVSSELCRFLGGILEESSVGEFRTRFEWAGSYFVSKNIPRDVGIDARSRGVIARTAERLRDERIEPRQVYSGPIIALEHGPQDDFGWITVSAVKRGRARKIRVRLSLDHYRAAVTWHHAGRPVLVEGEVQEDRRRSLYIDSPTRCRPVDEDQLPISAEPIYGSKSQARMGP